MLIISLPIIDHVLAVFVFNLILFCFVFSFTLSIMLSFLLLVSPFSVVYADPVFNVLDNYAGLICCAFLHVKLFDSLCILCTHGDTFISTKSKLLLVDLMGVVAKIFPEDTCCQIMTTPSLIQYAASIASLKAPDTAHKSFELIIALANAFSVSKLYDTNFRSAGDFRSFSISSFGGPSNSTSSTILSRSYRSSRVSLTPNGTTNNRRASTKVVTQPSMLLSSIALDMVHTSCTAGKMMGDSNGTKAELIHEMKLFLSSDVDKNALSYRTEITKVLNSKEGKEPFKWDWPTIIDIIDFLSQHHDRLGDVIKTKFIRRICGFYRCSLEEKGYFVNMEWEPTKLHYLECSCILYSLLVDTPLGLSFLESDRRGALFHEMINQFDQLIQSEVTVINGINSLSKNVLFNKPNNVFKLFSMNKTMAREYFCLLGRLASSQTGRTYLETTSILIQICNFGVNKVLDYVSRVAITSLCFTDCGYMSKNLIQIWTKQDITSKNLCIYCYTLLDCLLRCRTKEFSEWCLNLIIDLLVLKKKTFNDTYIIKYLETLCQDRIYLKSIVIRDELDITLPVLENVLVRYFAINEGFISINNRNLVNKYITSWKEKKTYEYVDNIEKNLVKALNGTHLCKRISSNISPISIQCLTFSNHPSANNGDLYPDGGVDVEGLLRIPWNIEVKVASSSNSNASSDGGEHIKLDTYLDCSNLHQNYNTCNADSEYNEVICDYTRLVKVRAIVMDSRGLPSSFPLMNDRTLMTSLFVGVCPVTKDGRVYTSVNDSSSVPLTGNLNASTSNLAGNNGSSYGKEGTAGADSPVPKFMKQTSTIARKNSLIIPTAQSSSRLSELGDRPNMTNSSEPLSTSALQFESLIEWSVCKPSHRQKMRQIDIPEKPGMFSIEIPGEPIVLIFNRFPKSSNINLDKVNKSIVYLEEIHYMLRLETGQSSFLRMPIHLYGQMARTTLGLKSLITENILSDNIKILYQDNGDSRNVRVAVWSLGHIGSTEIGMQAILSHDDNFVKRLIELATSSNNYAIRSASFSALGLISRNVTGSQQLHKCQWDCAPFHGIAVAIPRYPGDLFRHTSTASSKTPKNEQNIKLGKVGNETTSNASNITSNLKDDLNGLSIDTLSLDVHIEDEDVDEDGIGFDGTDNKTGKGFGGNLKSYKQSKIPVDKFSISTLLIEYRSQRDVNTNSLPGPPINDPGSTNSNPSYVTINIENEIIKCLSKLPGQILHNENYNKILQYKKDFSYIFDNRAFYILIHKILSHFTFKLSIRKFIIGLFSALAKKL